MSLGALGVPVNHTLMGQTHWGVREPEPNCSASRCRVGAGLGSGAEQPRLRPGSPGHRPRFSKRVPELPVRPAQGRRGAGAAGRGTDLLPSLAGRRVHPTPGKMEPRASWPQQRILCRLREENEAHRIRFAQTLFSVYLLCACEDSVTWPQNAHAWRRTLRKRHLPVQGLETTPAGLLWAPTRPSLPPPPAPFHVQLQLLLARAGNSRVCGLQV